jgi:hypothetical protein
MAVKSPYHSDRFVRENEDELHFDDFFPTLSEIIKDADRIEII